MTWLRGSRPRELGHEAYRIHRAAPSWGTTSLRALALGQGLPDAGLRVGAGEAPYQDEGGNDGSERGSGESRRTGVGFTRRSRRMNQAGKPTRGQRVALYARVSSDKQEEEGTIDSQLSALREHIAAAGETLEEAMCFVDDGFSGTTLQRPALERLRDQAAAGAIDR